MGDINDKSTFDSAAKWLEVVRSHTSLRLSTAIPVILVGNKCDLLSTQKDVKEAEDWVGGKA